MVYKVPDNVEPLYHDRVSDTEVRQTLHALLGVKQPPQTVEYAVEEEESSEGMRIQRLRYSNMLGETVPAILITPADAEPSSLPAVVCSPGTAGNAQRLTEEEFRRDEPNKGPLRGWARELARRRFVTLSLTLKLNDERRGSTADFEQQIKLLGPYGIPPMGWLVDEVLRGARLLAGHKAVNPGRIGLTGMSLGANATWYAFACAAWIKAAVPVCGGLGSLSRFVDQGDPQRHGCYFYVPNMLRYFDHATIVRTCITPRPLLVIAPTQDEDMPSAGVDDLINEVKPAYEQAGAAEHFRVRRPQGHHEYCEEYFEHMVAWFEKYL